MKVYAGIGSRRTPPDVLRDMTRIAERLRALGWRLRSGHAPGADQAFEAGAKDEAEVYLPWGSFERDAPMWADKSVPCPTHEAYHHAMHFHPVWFSLKPAAKTLMARNSHQVLGFDLRTPVRFLMCWTPRASGEGGTGQAIRIARECEFEIPVFDLALDETRHHILTSLSLK